MLVRILVCAWVLLGFALNLASADTKSSSDQQSQSFKIQRIRFQSPVGLSSLVRQELLRECRKVGLRFAPQTTSELLVENCEELVREAYQDKGYFKVKVSSDFSRVAERNVQDLIFEIEPGSQYSFSEIVWEGATVFDPAELNRLFSVNRGETFSRSKFAAGLEAVRRMYYSIGYINYIGVPAPLIDEEAKTIGFTIDVDEGGQFRFGCLTIVGMRPEHEKIVLNAWEGLRGQPYSSAEADRFFTRFLRSPLAWVKPEDYTSRHINEREHLVDYSLELAPRTR